MAEERMPTNTKEPKGVGKTVINAVGFLSFLFGSLILLAITVGTIGGIFVSTRRLLQIKRTKKDKDDGPSKEGGNEKD